MKLKEPLLFPAVPGKGGMMNRYWIRDNYYIYHAASDETKERIYKGFEKIVKKHEDNIRAAVENPPKEDYQHIHPVYNQDYNEIDGDWGFVQNDSVGNLLEVLARHNSPYAELIYDYLMAIEWWKCPDFGMWEEGPKRMHVGSLAACIRGLEQYYKNDKVIEAIEKIDNIISNWKPDLEFLSILYPRTKGFVDESSKKIIIELIKPLMGEWGVKRYIGDRWNGATRTAETEPEWPLGFCFLYEITGDDYYLKRLDTIKNTFGYIPESIIDGKPNCNTPLNWAEFWFRKIHPDYKRI
ncbi:MAG: glycoside hydrolase family 15 protein [Elusimicrobiota bacterium]